MVFFLWLVLFCLDPIDNGGPLTSCDPRMGMMCAPDPNP